MPPAAAELALAALTVAFGLQLLGLMVTTWLAVYRERLGASLTGLALAAFLVVGLGFLAAPAARLFGRPRALVVSAAGVALVRLAVQLVPDPLARWLLAPLKMVLFLWFVPLWLDRDGRGFGLALLVGQALDGRPGRGAGRRGPGCAGRPARPPARPRRAKTAAGRRAAASRDRADAVPARPRLAEPGLAGGARRPSPRTRRSCW